MVLQFAGSIEVIFDGTLLPAGDKDHLLDARGHHFLHDILNRGFVDDGQEFLGDHFRGG
jgi:hypothetical protein